MADFQRFLTIHRLSEFSGKMLDFAAISELFSIDLY